eukprot:3864505-Prymnesium_polylepis.1
MDPNTCSKRRADLGIMRAKTMHCIIGPQLFASGLLDCKPPRTKRYSNSRAPAPKSAATGT